MLKKPWNFGSSHQPRPFQPGRKSWKSLWRERTLPSLQREGIVRVLRNHGFAMISQKGSHQKGRHANGRQVIVAMHGNKPIPIGTLKSIIDGSGLSADDFR